jgi:hypothetical protein
VRVGREQILLVVVALTLSAGSACRQASVASTSTPRCPWTVTDNREATSADSAIAKRSDLLVEREETLRVPGPGGLVAVVDIDSLHHPQISIEDPTKGTRRHLIGGSRPRWSSDGSMIACTVWNRLTVLGTSR